MLIVTGLGRCGTSLMIDFIGRVGVEIARDHMSFDKNKRAGLEFAPAYSINRDLFTDFISYGKKIDVDKVIDTPYFGKISYRDRILKIGEDPPVDAIKDPRFMWHPDIIETWYKVRGKDIKVLILHREFEEVILSRLKAGWKDGDPKRRKNINELKIDFAEFMTRILKLGIAYSILYYPNFLKEYDSVYKALSHLDINFDKEEGKSIWSDLVNMDFVSSPEDLGRYRNGMERSIKTN